MKYEDIKAKFPGAYSVGGEIIARVDHEAVVVATYVNGSFSLTKRGEAAPAAEEKAPKVSRKNTKPAKADTVATVDTSALETVPVEGASLSDLLGE